MLRRLGLFVPVLMALVLILALPVNAQDGSTPSVEVADQLVLDGTVTIASATSQGPGFIVIHADNGEGGPGAVIGHAAVADGPNENVHVEIDAAAATPTLFAMLHTDTGTEGEYEFGAVEGADGPAIVDDAPVTPAFTVHIINATDQFAEDNAVRIASVTAPQAGWLVVHQDNGEGGPGPVLGQTLFNAGTTENLLVFLEGDPTDVLFPMMHFDTGVTGEYEFGTVDDADGPVRVGESVAVTAIWTVPHMRIVDQVVDASAPLLVADSVLSEGAGWLVVHSDADGSPGPVLGFAAVEDGLNTDVMVELDAENLTPVVWPMLHTDTGTEGEYEFGTVEGADGPVRVGEDVVVFSVNLLTEDMGMGDTGGDMGMLDGAALVEERCTVCHSRERIDNAEKDEAGWTATVDRMIDHGAVLNDDERAAVIEYLASSMSDGGDDMGMLDGDALVETRCTVCHSRERIDNAEKDEAGWTATVDRMIGYGAELNDDERAAVIEYLTSH